MTVFDASFSRDIAPVIAAGWQGRGNADVDELAGQAQIGLDTGQVRFAVTRQGVAGPGIIGSAPMTLPEGPWALRVDEVAFPVGAVAHLHSHTGSGWRYLVHGKLRIEGADGDQTMQVGNAWFEAAETPVRAVALQRIGVTRFVRCMVIPAAYIGQSTFCLKDAADSVLPRLQVTHRHFDHIVQGEAG